MTTKRTRSSQVEEIRQAAEADLLDFIRLVNPKQLLGLVHEEICRWWTREGAKSHQLLLVPRGHQKSRLMAYRCAWWITKYPDTTILYMSATSDLAVKQLKFIKDILTSKIYRRYWPEMVHPDEAKRERWTYEEIAVDHPRRKEELVRDPTIKAAGLTTNTTGFHFKVVAMDDIVTGENAYTNDGREKASTQCSHIASVAEADALRWVTGTRYHPKDQYGRFLAQMEQVFNDETGEIVGQEPVYEMFQREVEDRGDGTGEFLWPRQQRRDGQWFGFDAKILARKRAEYDDKTQYRAQYYNDPHDDDAAPIKREMFRYYNKSMLNRVHGYWYHGSQRLAVFAAMDLSYATTSRADWTTIAVVGVTGDRDYLVLDIDRFRTSQTRDYFNHLLEMHQTWGFGKVRIEVTAAQQVIVDTLRREFLRPADVALSIDDYRPARTDGAKEERILAVLKPRYENGQMYHYESGNCQILEEELSRKNPAHDDVKDALANAVSIAVAPTAFGSRMAGRDIGGQRDNVVYHPRFGGVAFR